MNEMFSQGGKGSVGILTNKQAVARVFGIKQSDIVYLSVGAVLSGYKVIYDKVNQRAYALPSDIPAGATIVNLNLDGLLVHSLGSVDLALLAVARKEFVVVNETFTTGATLNAKNELLIYSGDRYRWDGVFPKVVPASSTPESAGGIGAGKWLLADSTSQFDITSYEGIIYQSLGDFAVGKTLTKTTDVILNTATGWYYSYAGTLPHTIATGETIDSNWKALGNLNGYAYSHFLNWKNSLVTDNAALTAAFNTGYTVDLSNATATTIGDFTIPAHSAGITGGTIMLGGRLNTVPYDFTTPIPFTDSVRAGVTVLNLDGVDRTGQYIRIDNGFTFCIDDALAPGVTPDSIDGVALTKALNSYQSQYIQIVKVIGHTTGGSAILSEPLVVNQVSGQSKWSQCINNLTPLTISGVTIKPTSGTRRTLWLSQIDLLIEHCDFTDCTVEMHYGCYNSRFVYNNYVVTTKEHLDNDQPRISFSIFGSVAEIAHNKISTTGTGDADIAVYKQIDYVNVHDNQIASPLFGNTWYTPGHWSIVFHSAVYHSMANNNNVSSNNGIGAFVFCDDILISSNNIRCNVMQSAFCTSVTYTDNYIVSEGQSQFIGNTRLQFQGGSWQVREGGQRMGLQLVAGTRPFSATGFKIIEASEVYVKGVTFFSIVKNSYLNPKSSMTVPANNLDTVFPAPGVYLVNQQVGISALNVKLDYLEITGCTFNNLNYGVNIYRAQSVLGSVRLRIADNDFNCDAGILLRGQSGSRHFSGDVTNNSFGPLCVFGIINANIQGLGITKCSFASLAGSGMLVASAANIAMQCLMDVNCTYNGAAGSGFKYYDYNGNIASYSLDATQANCHTLPHGMWFYQPSENILTSSGVGIEYCNAAYYNGSVFVGTVLKKTNSITTIP